MFAGWACGYFTGSQKETVEAFLRTIPLHLQTTINGVCTELYEGYIQIAQPAVRRVADRFHVAKLYRATTDMLRKTELKRLKAAVPATQYETLKGSLWAFRRHRLTCGLNNALSCNVCFELSPALS